MRVATFPFLAASILLILSPIPGQAQAIPPFTPIPFTLNQARRKCQISAVASTPVTRALIAHPLFALRLLLGCSRLPFARRWQRRQLGANPP